MIMENFCSVGHSNRTLEEFLAIMRDARVQLLVDVRSFPRSRSNPAFNIDSFPAELQYAGVGYVHMRSLGGRRPRQRSIDALVNGLWRVQAFHNYADYALGDEFAGAFADLMILGRDQRVAIMCSEAVWWRCHRRIIVDYLLANGKSVDHLMARGQTVCATLTLGARVTAEGKVLYPASI